MFFKINFNYLILILYSHFLYDIIFLALYNLMINYHCYLDLNFQMRLTLIIINCN